MNKGQQKYIHDSALNFLELSQDLICIAGFDGYFKYLNPSWKDTLGYTVDELMSKPYLDFIHPDDHLKNDNEVDKLSEGNKTINFENRYIHKNGDIVYISWKATPKLNEKVVYCIGRNVTEQKEKEEIISERNKKIELLLNGSRLVLEDKDFLSTAQQIFDYCRALTGAKSGYVALLNDKGEENEVLFLDSGGMPCSVDESLPMPIRGLRGIVYKSSQAVYHNDFMNSEHIKWMPGGHVVLKNVLFAPLLINKKTVGLIGLANKPTDFNDNDLEITTTFGELASISLKKSRNYEELIKAKEKAEESKETLELALKGARAGLWSWNIATGEDLLDERWCGILGYKKEELEQHVSSWQRLIHPDDKERIYEVVNKHFEDESNLYDDEYRMRCKSGEWKWIHAIGKVVERDSEGNPYRMTGIIIDIDRQKETEIEIAKNAEELNQLNRDKDRFIKILAHDLKNPLNSILGFSKLLVKNLHKYNINKIESQLKIINTATQKTYDLLEQILLWTKSQSGKLRLEKQRINFIETTTEIIETIENQANEKSIKINVFETDKIAIQADLNMYKTIMRNLISNAVKFTKHNGQINIYAEKSHSDTVITVSDNGIGIEKEIIPKLWKFNDNFTTPGTNNEKGTGFGLTLCKELIEKHGGEIWVESEVGKGSDFKFTLQLINKEIIN